MSTVETALEWGSVIDGKKYYPLHREQKAIIHSDVRFTAGIAGTGGGKTVCGPLWIMRQILKIREKKGPHYKINGMVIAPTYKVLSRATVPTLIDTFKGTQLEGVYKETKNVYELPNKSGKIWCQGADNPGGLEGGQFDWVWIDEGGQLKLSAWIALQGRTGAKEAPILITTTPYGKNWLFHEFFKRFEAGDKNYFVRQWASILNPTYPVEEYNRARGSMSAEKAAMRYDGIFMQMEGLVYPEFYTTAVEVELEKLLIKSGRLYGGIDFGWNEPFAALAGFLDEDDILWVFYERYLSETPIEKHAEMIPKFADKRIKWYADRMPEFILKLRKGGHKVVPAFKAIEAGIDALNARILTGRLKVLKNRCPAVFAEAESYAYPEKDEITIGNLPEKNQADHALDALRYMVAGIDLRKAA